MEYSRRGVHRVRGVRAVLDDFTRRRYGQDLLSSFCSERRGFLPPVVPAGVAPGGPDPVADAPAGSATRPGVYIRIL